MPSISLIHYVTEKGVLVLDFSTCIKDFKKFEIIVGKVKSSPPWLEVTTDQEGYCFANLEIGEYFLAVGGKTRDNQYRNLRVDSILVRGQFESKLINWLKKK